MLQMIKTATILLGLMTIVTGVVYPVAVTVIAQIVFPYTANGSLFETPGATSATTSRDHQAAVGSATSPQTVWAGSDFIGQPFSNPKYFWGRPSATALIAYNSLGGSGSNQATTNPALTDAVRDRIAKLRAEDPDNKTPVPVDLVTTSASGLDPHISEAAALYQISRIARARMIETSTIHKLVSHYIERPTIGILGQSRINVLKLNLALDASTSMRSSQ